MAAASSDPLFLPDLPRVKQQTELNNLRALFLQLMRQGGSVELLFKSAKAGTAHWSSPLPLPVGIAFNVYHKHLACVVLNGCTTSRGNFMTDGVDALFVGEAYVLEVPASAQASRPPALDRARIGGHVPAVSALPPARRCAPHRASSQ